MLFEGRSSEQKSDLAFGHKHNREFSQNQGIFYLVWHMLSMVVIPQFTKCSDTTVGAKCAVQPILLCPDGAGQGPSTNLYHPYLTWGEVHQPPASTRSGYRHIPGPLPS